MNFEEKLKAMFPVTITPIQDEKDLAKLREFILHQPMSYPNYQDWVADKCIPRVANGDYKTLVVFHDKIIIGDAVYRFLNENDVEIKNFRIDEFQRHRDLGHFVLRQVEVSNSGKNLVTDVHETNVSALKFFKANGFGEEGKVELYRQGQREVILRKAA